MGERSHSRCPGLVRIAREGSPRWTLRCLWRRMRREPMPGLRLPVRRRSRGNVPDDYRPAGPFGEMRSVRERGHRACLRATQAWAAYQHMHAATMALRHPGPDLPAWAGVEPHATTRHMFSRRQYTGYVDGVLTVSTMDEHRRPTRTHGHAVDVDCAGTCPLPPRGLRAAWKATAGMAYARLALRGWTLPMWHGADALLPTRMGPRAVPVPIAAGRMRFAVGWFALWVGLSDDDLDGDDVAPAVGSTSSHTPAYY
jgi:hypothetical protein